MRVPLDANLAETLRRAADVCEIVDEHGGLVGVYTPTRKHVPPPGYTIPFTDAELDEFAKETGGRPLADILADLERKHGE